MLHQNVEKSSMLFLMIGIAEKAYSYTKTTSADVSGVNTPVVRSPGQPGVSRSVRQADTSTGLLVKDLSAGPCLRTLAPIHDSLA